MPEYRVVIIDFNLSLMTDVQFANDVAAIPPGDITWNGGTPPYNRHALFGGVKAFEATPRATTQKEYWIEFDLYSMALVLCDLLRGYIMRWKNDDAVQSRFSGYCHRKLVDIEAKVLDAKVPNDTQWLPSFSDFCLSPDASKSPLLWYDQEFNVGNDGPLRLLMNE